MGIRTCGSGSEEQDFRKQYQEQQRSGHKSVLIRGLRRGLARADEDDRSDPALARTTPHAHYLSSAKRKKSVFLFCYSTGARPAGMSPGRRAHARTTTPRRRRCCCCCCCMNGRGLFFRHRHRHQRDSFSSYS